MVRRKTRWLLVQLDFPKSVVELSKAGKLAGGINNSSNDQEFPAKKELATSIRQNMATHFGIAAEAAAMDTQVRLCDPTTRLLLLRAPRAFSGMVRSSLTLWTHHRSLKTEQPSNSRIRNSSSLPNVRASVVAVHGSARTAKLATLARLRKIYRARLQSLQPGTKPFVRECRKLHDLVRTVQNID